MQNESTHIRLMQPGDLERVARIHLLQFPNSRSTRLGKPFVRKMYHWFITHHPNLSLVAINQGIVAGFVVGAVGSYGQNVFRYALPQILWGLLIHPRLIFKEETYTLWRSFLRGLLPGTHKPSGKTQTERTPISLNAALSSIAVAGDYLGRGTGKLLVQKFEEQAKARGAKTVSLSVEKENLAAQSLYKSCGWTVNFEKSDGFHFVKILDSKPSISDDSI